MAPTPEATDLLCVIRHPVGGIVTYMRYVYRQLDSRRFRVSVVSARETEAQAVFPTLGFAKCEFVRLNDGWGLVRLVAAVVRALFRGNFGLLHSQGATAGAVVAAINLFWRKPHVITFHETFDGNTLRGRMAWLKRRILSYLFSCADRVNVVSEDARRNMLEHFSRMKKVSHKIIVIPNGVDVGYLTASGDEEPDLRSRFNIEPDKIVIGYLGRFMPEKGFPVLIEAMSILVGRGRDDIVVVAVGSGAYEREYRALIRERGIESQFHFLPYQRDVRWILRQATIIAIPSLREAYPLLAIEALVLGCSIVASRCIGLRELLNGTPAEMVTPGDPGALASGIENAATLKQRRRAQEYRQLAEDRFDVRATARQLSAVFREVLASDG